MLITPETLQMLDTYLNEVNVRPVNTGNLPQAPVIVEQGEESNLSLLLTTKLAEFESTPKVPGGVVQWAPPQPNWNPWTSANIDEGPLVTVNVLT